ncbi:tryptophan halogenase family protein [Asticcacaulis sp. 201]|uniref:tryptophan halogenase family protein n=1 Tax=Asticcacaulis sp. 201 TaxID=3028787 RepID=UPI002916CDE6|nr:tryptophan halogenase family protein [Asticcacaulis sp. 201]MDV6331618.1 tryptophan halogenase family protein [Asticcacaulis sp. 201]
MSQTRSVVIVGGGTAGWLTAGLIAANHKGHLSVTLVESPNVKIIGVGEGTWPTIRNTLKKIGISETDFLRACDGTFKQASKFVNWTTGDDHYYHPFMLPKAYDQINLAPYWQAQPNGLSFADAVSYQPAACAQDLAPKTVTVPEFGAITNYAYHLDAGKFAPFLQKHCVENLGVRHVLADVTQIENDEDGYIARLLIDGGEAIAGDLFIDCTGFLSLLIGKHYGAEFTSCADQLFIDTALAIQVPYEHEDAPIASVTKSTAQRAGWIWDIGLTRRRGIGHVYSSRFLSDDEALADLKAYIGPSGAHLTFDEVRKIPIRSGHRQTPWVKNCVAVGLSSGFVEPLEASSIVMAELSAQMIADQMPVNRTAMAVVEKRFNATLNYRWARIIDFLKLHYVLSQREEPFWVANRDPSTIPESLKDLLSLWRYHFPWHDDLDRRDEIFPTASFQYVYYGMGGRTDPGAFPKTPDWPTAIGHFQEVARARQAVTGQLPTNRTLLNKISQFGLQKV